MKKLLPLLFLGFACKAQLVLKGTIVDSSTRAPIAYAYCGVIGKSLGTVTNGQGQFELKLSRNYNGDSVKFSAMGYGNISRSVQDLINKPESEFAIVQGPTELEEVIVRAKHMKTDKLGAQKFSERNCSGFVKNESSWKGSQAAVLVNNTVGKPVNLDAFVFFIVHNRYSDSLKFRLMLYEVSEKKYPRMKTLNKRPIIFNLGTPSGQFILDLKPYNIRTDKDFFVSLECLSDEVDITKFCYTGANEVPSFVKPSPFERWQKTKGGGSEFTIKVSFDKE